MSAISTTPAGGGPAEAAAGSSDAPARRPGRTTIADRVLTSIAEQAAASALGIERSRVSVHVGEARGGLGIRVRGPVPVPRLDDVDAIAREPALVDRVSTAQQTLRDDVSRITGRDVTRVDIVVTGALVAERRRVR